MADNELLFDVITPLGFRVHCYQACYPSPIEGDTPGNFHLIKNEAGQVIGAEFQFDHLRPGSVTLEMETAPLFIEQLLAMQNK